MQAIKNKQIILHSDGKQLRDFIPIDEFCRTLKFIVMNCMKDRNYNVMNIGGKTMDINEITKMVIQIFEKKYNQSIDVIKKDMQTNTKINSLDYKMSWTDKYNFKKIFEPNNEIENLIEFVRKNKELIKYS